MSLARIAACGLSYKTLTYLIKSSPKSNLSRQYNKQEYSNRSKAFSASKESTKPSICNFWKTCVMFISDLFWVCVASLWLVYICAATRRGVWSLWRLWRQPRKWFPYSNWRACDYTKRLWQQLEHWPQVRRSNIQAPNLLQNLSPQFLAFMLTSPVFITNIFHNYHII